MESEWPSRETAAEQLTAHDRVSRRAQSIPRELVLMQAWSAALITVYIAIYLMASSTQMAGEGTATPFTLLFAILAFSGLMNGAQERFGIRARVPRATFAIAIVLIAIFMILLALSLFGPPYPWWVNLALPVAFFAALLVSGRGLLDRSTVDEHSTWAADPLTVPARLTTSLLGLALGALVAASATELAALITTMVTMVLLVAMLVAWTTSFGLARAGFEWSRVHWIAFSAAIAITFLAAMLNAWTTSLALPLAITMGVVAAATVIASAFVTIRAR